MTVEPSVRQQGMNLLRPTRQAGHNEHSTHRFPLRDAFHESFHAVVHAASSACSKGHVHFWFQTDWTRVARSSQLKLPRVQQAERAPVPWAAGGWTLTGGACPRSEPECATSSPRTALAIIRTGNTPRKTLHACKLACGWHAAMPLPVLLTSFSRGGAEESRYRLYGLRQARSRGTRPAWDSPAVAPCGRSGGAAPGAGTHHVCIAQLPPSVR